MNKEAKFHTPLKPKQVEGIKFLLKRKSGGLTHSTGLGKTLSGLVISSALYKNDKVDYILVFIIKSALKAFVDDVEEHTNLDLNIVKDTGKFVKGPVVNLIQYNLYPKIGYELGFLVQHKRVVACFDEVQMLKTPTSKTRKYYEQIRPHLDYCYGFTATALANHIEDLYHITDYITPGILGTLTQFKRQFCHLRKRSFKNKKGRRVVFYEIMGYKDLPILTQYVKKVWHIASETMEKRFNYISLGELTPEEDADYLREARGIMEDSPEYREWVIRLPRLQHTVDLSQTKMLAIKKIIDFHHRSNKGLLVFFPYKEPMRRLKDLLEYDVEVFTGETSQKERFRIRDEFVEDKILLCTSAAARSLNFHAVNTVLFYTVPFEIEFFIQVIGRVARPFVSKHEYVVVLIPYIEETSDVYRIELMKMNADLVNKVFDGSPNLPKDIRAKRRSMLKKLRRQLLWRIQN